MPVTLHVTVYSRTGDTSSVVLGRLRWTIADDIPADALGEYVTATMQHAAKECPGSRLDVKNSWVQLEFS